MANNLKDHLKEVADAIRAKKGTSDLINPQDFATEIEGVTSGVPINNQNKVVDITENGTTEVVADGGYTGLGKVTINTEVSGGGGSTIEYVSVEGKSLFEWGEALAITAFLVKMPTKIVPVSLHTGMGETVDDAIAFALDPTMEFDFQGTRMTIADFLVSVGVDLSTYTHLTKEQFYDLNA